MTALMAESSSNGRPTMNVARTVAQNGRRLPQHKALVWRDRTWTWKEVDDAVSALAAELAARGLGKGDRILVHSPNCDEMFLTLYAAFRLGAVWVPTNFRLLPDEIVYQAQSSGACAFLCHGDYPDHAARVLEACPDVRFVWRIGEGGLGEDSIATVLSRKAGVAFPDAAVSRDDPAWFFYTSGTTGRPKAAVLTHGVLGFMLANYLADLTPGTTEDDPALVVAPLSHGAAAHQMAQTARGAATILLPTPSLDVEEAFRLIAAHKVATMFTVPTILKRMVEHPAVDAHDHSSLRQVVYAGAPMYREDQKLAIARLGKVLVQYYGLGECGGTVTVLPAHLHDGDDKTDPRPGTCGIVRTGMQVSIRDEDGNELEPGGTGEICVIGPAVFPGYHDNPEANEAAFRDGWFRTGDVGRMDAEGYVYISGRVSDMFISGGSNVYPREIEEKILTHPAIDEVAVVGMPDREWGEVGVAVCVLKPGSEITEAELAAFTAGKVSKYKLPHRFLFWEALPKSGYGKVPKRILREMLEESLPGPPQPT